MALPTEWPPNVSEKELQELTLLATTYALSHGLQYLPVADPQPLIPTSAIHAPLALFPTPFPRAVFLEAQRLQSIYNLLYARVAMDEDFLDRVMGKIGEIDTFTGELWRGWKKVRDEGIRQELHLGIFRSDYMLHAPNGVNGDITLKQVEFNTISASFGTLSEQTAALHRYLLASTSYFDSSPHLKPENFPRNNTLSGLIEGLVEAHRAYGVPEARILFVVQAGERNMFDQRPMEYELLEKHGIHVIRQTFDQLARSATLDSARTLSVSVPTGKTPVEISTVYYRAGYTPVDYPTSAQYATRVHLERSRAIKCPSIQLQLAGGKKVQQVLTEPGVVESFLLDRDRWGSSTKDISQHDVDVLRRSWMGMWGLDGSGDQGIFRARAEAEKLVLKPQREGGGNNVYKSSIPEFLDSLPIEEREIWIAMELIETPDWLGNYLVRAGAGTEGAIKTEAVSELGIYGWALFGPGAKEVKEKEIGWLVRTKGKDSDEGGVATGFSVLDSLLLVD